MISSSSFKKELEWITKQKKNRVTEDFIIEFNLKGKSRKELRDMTVSKFLEEKRGYWEGGIKKTTKYKYFVEKLSDNKRIYLLRPTFLNKGIDFQVWVERFYEDGDKRPSHKDIFQDLQSKKQEDPKDYQKLLEAIDRVWNCEEPNIVLKDFTFTFKKGFSVEMLLKILKWLFIEQDITYWNYDGRTMLRMAIDKEVK